MTATSSDPGLRRILYAEDDSDIQHIARFALERIGGLEVQMCSNGQDALRQAPGFNPDLILLDVMLPEMDGPEVFRRLRELGGLAQVPVVFVTAKAHSQEIQTFRKMGVLDVLTKPFNPLTLAKDLAALWQRRAELRGARARLHSA